jgi:uncharacterized membrane protein
MEYDHVISDVVRVVEAVGAGIMVVGGLGAFVIFIARAAQPDRRGESYGDLRRNLGRSVLLGVEVPIVADIVRTIIVDRRSRAFWCVAVEPLAAKKIHCRRRTGRLRRCSSAAGY